MAVPDPTEYIHLRLSFKGKGYHAVRERVPANITDLRNMPQHSSTFCATGPHGLWFVTTGSWSVAGILNGESSQKKNQMAPQVAKTGFSNQLA